MTFDRVQGKALIQSKSFWGAIAMALGVFLPKYVTQLQGAVDDVVIISGLIVTIFGRFTASQPVTGVLTARKD